jgi:hypothetical protein
MTLSDYCPLCIAQNVVASRNGPTCQHHALTGADWFPSWWLTSTEAERIKFLERQTQTNGSI